MLSKGAMFKLVNRLGCPITVTTVPNDYTPEVFQSLSPSPSPAPAPSPSLQLLLLQLVMHLEDKDTVPFDLDSSSVSTHESRTEVAISVKSCVVHLCTISVALLSQIPIPPPYGAIAIPHLHRHPHRHRHPRRCVQVHIERDTVHNLIISANESYFRPLSLYPRSGLLCDVKCEKGIHSIHFSSPLLLINDTAIPLEFRFCSATASAIISLLRLDAGRQGFVPLPTSSFSDRVQIRPIISSPSPSSSASPSALPPEEFMFSPLLRLRTRDWISAATCYPLAAANTKMNNHADEFKAGCLRFLLSSSTDENGKITLRASPVLIIENLCSSPFRVALQLPNESAQSSSAANASNAADRSEPDSVKLGMITTNSKEEDVISGDLVSPPSSWRPNGAGNDDADLVICGGQAYSYIPTRSIDLRVQTRDHNWSSVLPLRVFGTLLSPSKSSSVKNKPRHHIISSRSFQAGRDKDTSSLASFLHVETEIDGHGVTICRIYAEVWLVNLSPWSLIYKERDIDNEEHCRSIASAPSPLQMIGHRSPSSATMISIALQQPRTRPSLPLPLLDREDGSSIVLNAIDSSAQYELSMHIERAKGRFARTRVVTISSQYCLVNRLPVPLKIRQLTTQKEFLIDRGDVSQRFFWANSRAPKTIQIALLSAGDDSSSHSRTSEDSWSGAISLTALGRHDLALPKSCPPHFRWLDVEVQTRGTSVFVLFCVGDLRYAPCRVENLTNLSTVVYQTGSEKGM